MDLRALVRLTFFVIMGVYVSQSFAQENNVSGKTLLNPFETGSHAGTGAWRMKEMKVSPLDAEDAKAGRQVFRFSGVSEIDQGKADCSIYPGKIESISKLSLWVKIHPDSNIHRIGFQTNDNEGEGLFVLFDVDWTGWKKIETDFVSRVQQAWPQGDKNGRTDFPLSGIRLVWFTKEKGYSYVDVDCLEFESDKLSGIMEKNFYMPEWSEIGQKNTGVIVFNNGKSADEEIKLEILIQEDSRLYNMPTPDPVLGTNHALGAKGWLLYDDKKVEDMSLTDGDPYSTAETEWINNHFTEAAQIIDLGRTLNVKEIKFRSGDANWVWRMNVLVSEDGNNFTPVPELCNIDMHKRWGEFALGVKTPFNARFIKLQYTTENNEKKPIIRMPCQMMVYDGLEDEKFDFPQTGKEILRDQKILVIPAGNYLIYRVEIPELSDGGYLISMKLQAGTRTELNNFNYFSFQPAQKTLGEKSRFGINGADLNAIKFHKQLGVGWIRFENLKWAFISPEKDKFAFDGSVGPWYVNQDAFIKAYTEAGISYLPYVFVTPMWATSAPQGHKNARGFPPRDFNDYGACIFQIVARYGSVKHPDNALLTNDKVSGMGLLKFIELWNEPNLNAESWGPWVGTIESYFDLFRIGAEAAKKADPSITVTSCGWAGIRTEVISRMQTYKYPDGKCPADFADILNVHFYSGRSDPEKTFVDPNVQRGRKEPGPEDYDYETELRYLYEWWNSVRPNAPIWLTETGYDVGGPIGRDERYQAAKLPRCLMMALAGGIQKVFVYREIGSKPAQHAGAGLIREDRSYRPSFFTYATLIRELDGAKEGRIKRLIVKGNPDIWLYLWEKENGEKILSAWNLDDKSVLPLNLGECVVTDSFGKTDKINIKSDYKLSIFPVYIKNISDLKEIEVLEKEAVKRETEYQVEKKKFLESKKYLFDFGSKEFVGKKCKYGAVFEYNPVLSADIFDEKKGWGFDKAAHGETLAQWIASNIEKDTCKVNNQDFIVKTKPGNYLVEIHAVPFGKNPSMTVKSASVKLPLNTSKESPIATAKIKSDGKIIFTFGDWYNLAWIRVIEQ